MLAPVGRDIVWGADVEKGIIETGTVVDGATFKGNRVLVVAVITGATVDNDDLCVGTCVCCTGTGTNEPVAIVLGAVVNRASNGACVTMAEGGTGATVGNDDIWAGTCVRCRDATGDCVVLIIGLVDDGANEGTCVPVGGRTTGATDGNFDIWLGAMVGNDIWFGTCVRFRDAAGDCVVLVIGLVDDEANEGTCVPVVDTTTGAADGDDFWLGTCVCGSGGTGESVVFVFALLGWDVLAINAGTCE
jgi:hypothetical protein